MRKIELSDVKNILDYERERESFREKIIALKKLRRVGMGDSVSFVFENRDTVLSQIQEMVRAERIVDEKKIQDEIEVYSELLPGDDYLSATMFIEIEDQSRIKQSLERFLGITRPGNVFLDVDGSKVLADFEGGREEEETGRVSAVQYAKFNFDSESIKKFRTPGVQVKLVVNHQNYSSEVRLSEALLQSLRSDFAR